MARLRTVEKEATLIAEQHGHALFMPWRRHDEDFNPVTSTSCARCGETFEVAVAFHQRTRPHVAGPVNQSCEKKGGA